MVCALQCGGGKFPTGAVRTVKGVLPIALRAKADDKIGLLVPKDNAAEAAVVKGLQVIPIQNLREAVGFLEGEVKISPTRVDLARLFDQPHEDELDFADQVLMGADAPPDRYQKPQGFSVTLGLK